MVTDVMILGFVDRSTLFLTLLAVVSKIILYPTDV